MVLFALLSCFLCLYLICFAHIATASMSRDWLVSSLLSLVIDLVAFEALAAVSVAILGVLYLVCKVKCLLCLLGSIEGYRVIRSLVDF